MEGSEFTVLLVPTVCKLKSYTREGGEGREEEDREKRERERR
jgi:hypothetical protein